MTEDVQQGSVSKEDLWNLNNYILLKDYYDRTVSRIAARCIRQGNIAIEDYPFYGYILDVLDEICEVGDLIASNNKLYPYIEKKIVGGLLSLKKDLKDYHEELMHNSSPDMIREDASEIDKMKKLLGGAEEEAMFDPTKGAGMNMDDVVNKLMQNKQLKKVVKIRKPVNNNDEIETPSKEEV